MEISLFFVWVWCKMGGKAADLKKDGNIVPLPKAIIERVATVDGVMYFRN